jgi:hypothetical protein
MNEKNKPNSSMILHGKVEQSVALLVVVVVVVVHRAED